MANPPATVAGISATISWCGPPGTEIRLWTSSWTSSLADWLTLNVDPAARGTVGLAIFTEPKQPLNSDEWREDLLLTARKWYAASAHLAGTATVSCGHQPGSLDVGDCESTFYYIQWTARLMRFAEIIYATGAPVSVQS